MHTKLPCMYEEAEPIWKGLQRERATRIRDLLRQAQLLIPLLHGIPPPGKKPPNLPAGMTRGTLDEFEEYLYHGEYALAWNALARVAEREMQDHRGWEALAEAAMVIAGYERHNRYFMHILAHHVRTSVDLDEAIQSLPQRFATRPDSADAKAIVARLSIVREHDKNA
jgi:hypothetical protein